MTQPLNPDQIAELLALASAAAQRAYAPYSAFPVGAAVLTADGSHFSGVNIENASYGLTVCAERVAVWSAVAAGHLSLLAVAVVAPKVPGTTPCGACRQVLTEFTPPDGDLIIICAGVNEPELFPLATLLPRAFGGAMR